MMRLGKWLASFVTNLAQGVVLVVKIGVVIISLSMLTILFTVLGVAFIDRVLEPWAKFLARILL